MTCGNTHSWANPGISGADSLRSVQNCVDIVLLLCKSVQVYAGTFANLEMRPNRAVPLD